MAVKLAQCCYHPDQRCVAPVSVSGVQYQDPVPEVPQSSEEDESEPHSEQESEESELLSSEIAFLTIPEVYEFAFKAGAHDNAPKAYAEALTHPDAQKHYEAACDEIQSHLDNGTCELAQLPLG